MRASTLFVDVGSVNDRLEIWQDQRCLKRQCRMSSAQIYDLQLPEYTPRSRYLAFML